MRVWRLGLGIMGILLALTSGLMLIQRRNPPPPPMIVYQSRENGRKWFFIMNADGTNQQRLDDYFDIELPIWDYYSPQWSPDGRWIAFSSGGIHRLRLADGRIDNLTDYWPTRTRPTWSPDSRYILYTIGDMWRDVIKMRADGSHEVYLTDNDANNREGLWSPDGRWIAFLSSWSATSSSAATGLFLMRPDGSGIRQIVNMENLYRPTWSPDSEWIAFSQGATLYKVRIDGTDLQQITDFQGAFPTWSPDGEWIVFKSHFDGDDDIYRIRPDGSQLEQLTNSEGHETNPQYSPLIPDLAFAGGKLWVFGLFLLITPFGLASATRYIRNQKVTT